MNVVSLSDLTEGICRWLDAEGFGTYKADAPYSAQDRAITVKALPTSPDWAVAVTPYGVEDGDVLPNAEVYVQLRFRAPRDVPATAVDEWADEVAGLLHFGRNLAMGDIQVSQAQRTITAPLGVDDNGRFERADSYTLILNRNQ